MSTAYQFCIFFHYKICNICLQKWRIFYETSWEVNYWFCADRRAAGWQVAGDSCFTGPCFTHFIPLSLTLNFRKPFLWEIYRLWNEITGMRRLDEKCWASCVGGLVGGLEVVSTTVELWIVPTGLHSSSSLHSHSFLLPPPPALLPPCPLYTLVYTHIHPSPFPSPRK